MEFDFNRIINLIKRYFIEHAGAALRILLAVSGVIIIIACLANIGNFQMKYNSLVTLFYIFMFIGGFWFSSNIFKEVHNPRTGYRFITLPASNIEKFIYAWIFTSPVVIAAAFIIINMASWLALGICLLFMDLNYEYLNLFDHDFGEKAKLYIVIQPIFLLGAAFFKRLNFFNTILWLLIIGFALNLITMLFGVIIFHPLEGVDGQKIILDGSLFKMGSEFEEFIMTKFVPVINFLFYYIMAPVFLVIAFFRLKEIEIS